LYVHETPVRFGDTDMMGHVNNAAYSTFLEDARIAFFQGAWGTPEGQGALILARTELDFVRPAHFGLGPVRTSLWVEHIGTKSFRLGYVLNQSESVVARAATVLVGYDYTANASRALTDAEKAALAPFAATVS
jgi:acyl-CoA thioester hydrolase